VPEVTHFRLVFTELEIGKAIASRTCVTTMEQAIGEAVDLLLKTLPEVTSQADRF
jgi:hypothetical protein